MTETRNVILFSAGEHESATLQRILSEHASLVSVSTLPELLDFLKNNDCDAVFCGWTHHTDTWRTVLELLQIRYPNLPVIVFHRTGGEVEWIQALEAGAFDLLVPPYLKGTVIPLLEHAVATRDARRWHNGGEQKGIEA